MYRVALAFLLAGCSPVSRIANNTNEIRTQAQLLADHGMAINDPVVVTGATRIDTLAAGMLDPSKPEDAREYIAARRASDPYFDAAFKKARAGKKETA